MASLKGKVALVTGASSGMGRASAIALAREGAAIVVCDLKSAANPSGYEADLNQTTVEVIQAFGGSATFKKADISDFKELEKVFEEAVQEYGHLDILINCAGYCSPASPFSEQTDETWNKTFAINTAGTAKASRLALQQFLKQDKDEAWGSRGRIVNISSCSGTIGIPGGVAYAASKAAINHITRAGAQDHAKDWININCVAPGVVATGMSRSNLEDKGTAALLIKATPWPRLGTADDIASVVVFFCMPGSSWITGQILGVDGGITIGVPAP